MFSRRQFIVSVLTASVLPVAAHASDEPHAIYPSDIEKVPYKFRKRVVSYKTTEPKGTIIVDTSRRYLFLVMGGGRAVRYGVGIGKKGFEWTGEATIQRKARWPTWTPTPDQILRVPKYKQWASGYPGGALNPLGARSLYLFKDGVDTLFRIHGTTEPHTIGSKVSSGCLRMINVDIIDLFDRVELGTKVIVN